MMPANRVLQNNTRLMRQLLGDRVARAFRWQNADGELIPGSGFDVVGEPYRLVAGDGTVHRGIFVLGLQLSSVQWGTAIAAQSGDVEDPAARTLGDAHLVVNELARLSGLGISHLSLRRSQQAPKSAWVPARTTTSTQSRSCAAGGAAHARPGRGNTKTPCHSM